MPNDLPSVGPALDAAIAVEVKRWHKEDIFPRPWWYDADGKPVIAVEDFRPSTDPTTLFADVMPEMLKRGWIPHPRWRERQWLFWWGRPTDPFGLGELHESIASAGCLAALVAVRTQKGANDV